MRREKPKQDKKTYGLRLSQSLMKELEHVGVDQERWINDLVEEAIRDLLKKYRAKE